MEPIQALKEMAQRIDDGTRIEGDADCVFFAGHWHGKPKEGGTVAALDVVGTLLSIPTEQFTDAEGRILFDVTEDGSVAPKGTLAKLAEEAEKAAAEITPEPPAEDQPERGEDFTEEAKHEEQLQPVAQDAPETSTDAPAAAQEEAPVQETAPVAEAIPEAPVAVTEPAVPEVTAPIEEPTAPVTEEAPAETVTTDLVTEAPAEPEALPETSTEPVAETVSEPTPTRKKRATL